MNEMGKRERLRLGEAVELKPGIFGRLNKEKRTLELDSGKTLPISETDQRDLFPQNEASLDVTRRTEKLENQVKNAPFGQFLHQFGQSGIAGASKDWIDYFTKSGDQYLRQKQAQGKVSQRISEEAPFTSGAATVASFAPDIALTHGMSALKAAPLLTAASAGSRIVTEPEEVAGESLVAAGAGKILDIGANALNKMAARRATIRNFPNELQAVQKSNMAGELAVKQANAAQTAQFNALKQNVKDVNQQKLVQYQQEVDARQNRMIDAKNKMEAAQFATSQEKKRLSEEFKLAQKQHKEALANLPRLEKEAQQEYGKNVVKNVENIEKAFPKNAKITSIQIDVPGFFDQTIRNSRMVGSPAEAQTKRILSSLFPEAENFTAKELTSKYRAIEGAIQDANPEVREILNQFKTHMGEKLPMILADNISFNKVVPSLTKQIEKGIESAIRKLPQESGYVAHLQLNQRIQKNLNKYFSELSPARFTQKLQSGELKEELLNRFLSPIEVAPFEKPKGKIMDFTGKNPKSIPLPETYRAKYEQIKEVVSTKIDSILADAELKTIATDIDASKKLGANIKRTYGIAEPLPTPLPSSPPILPPTNTMPIPKPLKPHKPILTTEPTPPTPISFNPQPEPILPPAQGFSENAGDFLEKNLLGGRSLANNAFTKLAGLKYVLGKAALPLEAGYLGMKGLTSPTAGGEIARLTFKQSGIQAIESWAQKYPSYHDGILEDPRERRSLTKEIEDAADIPLEQKAMIQSKINRGKPLTQSLVSSTISSSM